jgi:hypothetical protein
VLVASLAVSIGATANNDFSLNHILTMPPRTVYAHTAVAGIVMVSGVEPADMEQPGTCGGVPQRDLLARFTKPVRIDRLVVCSSPKVVAVPQTKSIVRTPQTAPLLDAISRGLATPDTLSQPGDGCLVVGHFMTPFAVEVQGHMFRPTLPMFPCGYMGGTTTQALVDAMNSTRITRGLR